MTLHKPLSLAACSACLPVAHPSLPLASLLAPPSLLQKGIWDDEDGEEDEFSDNDADDEDTNSEGTEADEAASTDSAVTADNAPAVDGDSSSADWDAEWGSDE